MNSEHRISSSASYLAGVGVCNDIELYHWEFGPHTQKNPNSTRGVYKTKTEDRRPKTEDRKRRRRRPGGGYYTYFGYGDVPSGRVSIFTILV